MYWTSPIQMNCLSGSFTSKGFNFAKSSATSNDLEEQARDLLRAMESDKRIDMNTFWKVSVVYYLLRSLNLSLLLISSW